MRVNEIFTSLQGEGHYTGTPAVFLRLSGCNLACPFCDTQFQSFVEMTEEEILQDVAGRKPRHIVITGGEPSLQLTESLVDKLHKEGFFVQIETNGTMPLPNGIDWVTCSPKKGGEVVLERVDEVKMVYEGEGTDLAPALAIPAKEYRLQPVDTGNDAQNKIVVQQTIDYLLEHPTWRLSLQTHKILNVR